MQRLGNVEIVRKDPTPELTAMVEEVFATIGAVTLRDVERTHFGDPVAAKPTLPTRKPGERTPPSQPATPPADPSPGRRQPSPIRKPKPTTTRMY